MKKQALYLLLLLKIFLLSSSCKKIDENFFKSMYIDLVQNGNYEKIPNYFSSDASINLDGKELNYEEFIHRVKWMQKRNLTIDFKQALINGNDVATWHFSQIDNSTFKVFARIKMKNNKIFRFEHIALKIQGNAEQKVVNDF